MTLLREGAARFQWFKSRVPIRNRDSRRTPKQVRPGPLSPSTRGSEWDSPRVMGCLPHDIQWYMPHIRQQAEMALSGSLYSKMTVSRRWVSGRDLTTQACMAGLYFLTGKIGLLLLAERSFAAVAWPPTGVALAAVLLVGYEIWPGLLFGSFLLNLTVFSSAGVRGPALVVACICTASGCILATLTGAWLVETYAGGRAALRQLRTILVFVALAAVGSTLISATSGAVVCRLAHLVDWRNAGGLWLSWWLADMEGVIILTPLVLAWSTSDLKTFSAQRVVEGTALIGLLLLICWVTFGGWFAAQHRVTASLFLVIPILMWTAFRFGQRGTTIVTVILGYIATAGTFRGHGPFVMANPDTSLFLLQDFVGVVALMSLLLAAEVDQRRLTEAGVHESDERLKLALSASHMGIWTMELKDQVRIISAPESDALLGLEAGEFDGSEKALFDMIHPEDRQTVRQAISRAIKIQGDYETEFRILPRDRATRWVLSRGSAYLDSRREPNRLVGVAIDITALKQAQEEVLRLNVELERRVADRTAQLEAISKELEAFSYSVSHDLRAPLRSIRGFSQVLLDRYASKLDARGAEFLRRAAESSQSMDTLIDDLLQLSKISRAELRPQPVDLSALAETVAAELGQAEPKRAVKFVIAPGLQASGEERLLRIVLENLLRNAWKFTVNQPRALIEFGHSSGPPAAFFVRDNGAGFDMKYADRLFNAFQRLHSANEFPGRGIGLATVQRILNRHGGRAWAEGALQQGATFYFTLPAHDNV